MDILLLGLEDTHQPVPQETIEFSQCFPISFCECGAMFMTRGVILKFKKINILTWLQFPIQRLATLASPQRQTVHQTCISCVPAVAAIAPPIL